MTMLRKLASLFTATLQQPLHDMLDHNAITIFEQEIRQAEEALPTARYHLASVMAERKKLEREIGQLQESLQRRLLQTQAALDKSEEALALELANQIAEDEVLLENLSRQATALQAQEVTLTQRMRKAVQSVQHYRRELALAKSNRHAHNALGALGTCSSDLSTRLSDMESSLQKIRQQQAHSDDLNNALDQIQAEMSGETLQKRLQAAGISSGRHDGLAVLARLKKKSMREAEPIVDDGPSLDNSPV